MDGPHTLVAGAGTRRVGAASEPDPVVSAASAPLSPSTGPCGVRFAFYGRSASADGAHAAITRKLAAVCAALPADALIVACFADVGAWDGLSANARDEVNECTGWVLGRYTVVGGLVTLLRRCVRPTPAVVDPNPRFLDAPDDAPAFDVVACATVDRLSRRTFQRLRIEDTLAARGVAVFTADGPPSEAGRIEREGRATWLPQN